MIYTWAEYDRSFLILTRIKGSTLQNAWTSLSPFQRRAALTTVADYCDCLAQHRSQILTSVTGKPVLEPFLSSLESGLLGAVTEKESLEYFSSPSAGSPPLDGGFRFYHPDPGPGNIIISDGIVAGVIDWEAAGNYPVFWIATKPSVAPGLDFSPPIAGGEAFEWRKSLRMELERREYYQASG